MPTTVKHTRGSKAQQMRAEIVKLQEAGRKPRPIDIQRAMAARGVIVSSGHACVVLNSFLGKRRRRISCGRRIGKTAVPLPAATVAPDVTLPKGFLLSDVERIAVAMQNLAGAIHAVNKAMNEFATGKWR